MFLLNSRLPCSACQWAISPAYSLKLFTASSNFRRTSWEGC